MRKAFVDSLSSQIDDHEKWLFITGDLGFMALEKLQQKIGERFINAGIAEQNMVTIAASLAHEGFIPWIYSISPFVTLRPYEQIRNNVCLHKLPVKIVGNGGGYGYGIMGATHHNIEDIGAMRILPNMVVYVPFMDSDIHDVVQLMNKDANPNYLRLNAGAKTKQTIPPFQQWRKIKKGKKAIVIGTGPVVENMINSEFAEELEIWIVGIFPVITIPDEIIQSLNNSRKLIIVEEHTGQCSLRETISYLIINQLTTSIKIHSLSANGYPSGKYGDQSFHQKENALAGEGLNTSVNKFLDTIV